MRRAQGGVRSGPPALGSAENTCVVPTVYEKELFFDGSPLQEQNSADVQPPSASAGLTRLSLLRPNCRSCGMGWGRGEKEGEM